VSVRSVQRYISDGKLKALRLPGGRYRIRVEDADAGYVRLYHVNLVIQQTVWRDALR
jgi:predicted site-specific integrase-resolvase